MNTTREIEIQELFESLFIFSSSWNPLTVEQSTTVPQRGVETGLTTPAAAPETQVGDAVYYDERSCPPVEEESRCR
jgi:hypothetical protein